MRTGSNVLAAVKVGSEHLPEVQPAIIRSAPHIYSIRAVSQKDVSRIKEMISRGILFGAVPREEKKVEPFPQPTPVQMEISVKYDFPLALSRSQKLNFRAVV